MSSSPVLQDRDSSKRTISCQYQLTAAVRPQLRALRRAKALPIAECPMKDLIDCLAMNCWKEPRFVSSRGCRTLAISNAPAYLHFSRITNTFLPELLIHVKYILLRALIIQGNFRLLRAFA
ncbi:MAG: hypothetical protein WBX12_06455, partial [Candidatus Acidiferrales bacterium]